MGSYFLRKYTFTVTPGSRWKLSIGKFCVWLNSRLVLSTMSLIKEINQLVETRKNKYRWCHVTMSYLIWFLKNWTTRWVWCFVKVRCYGDLSYIYKVLCLKVRFKSDSFRGNYFLKHFHKQIFRQTRQLAS